MSRVLCVDPGETTGWCLAEGEELLDSGQTPLWDFIELVWDGLIGEQGAPEIEWHNGSQIPFVPCYGPYQGVKQIVCEDWAIYPWEAKALSWDKCRTARGIGALELISRMSGVPLTLQPAKIKERAEANGAEALFTTPLHENRHANDAIRHWVFWRAVGERGGG